MTNEWIGGAAMDHDRLAMLARMSVGGDAIMLLLDVQSTRVVEVSPAAEAFYGWPRAEFLRLTASDLNPIGAANVRRMMDSVVSGGTNVHQVRHRTSSGEMRDVEIRARPIRVGSHDYVIATVFDLSEQILASAALEASEERYRRLVELSPDALFVEVDGSFAYLNPAALRLFGAEDASEIVGTEIVRFIHPDFRDEVTQRMEELQRGLDDSAPSRRKYVRLDGTEIDVEVRAVKIEYEGRPGAQVLVRDITQRVLAEAVLAWNAAIVDSSDDAVYSEDIEGVVLNWNKSAERIYGYTAREIVGRSVYDTLIPPELAEDNRERLRSMWLEDRPEHFETVRMRGDGTPIDVAVTLSPIHNPDGLVIGISAIGRDISERKQLDQAKDEFLSLVSHELRAPLTTILGYSQLLAEEGREFSPEKRAEVGAKVHKRATDMLALVEEILDATRLSSSGMDAERQAVDPARMIEGLAESFADSDRARLRVTSQSGCLPVHCDPQWLTIAVGNLIGNALKFSGDGEPVSVEVRQSEELTVFAVHDRGPGVDPAIGDRLFDRFVQGDMSSSRPHEGAGLGLYIAKRVTEMHGGTISSLPREGGGSTFSIAVPTRPGDV